VIGPALIQCWWFNKARAACFLIFARPQIPNPFSFDKESDRLFQADCPLVDAFNLTLFGNNQSGPPKPLSINVKCV
jgi:hypothetical protein